MESNFRSTQQGNEKEYQWLVKPIVRLWRIFVKQKTSQLKLEQQEGTSLMATRIFCDHCGLKIPSATKFYFGKCQTNEPMAQQAALQTAYQAQQASIYGQNIYQGGLLGQTLHPPPAPPIHTPAPSKAAERYYATVIVDLCDICVPIWYERANNLCKANKD
jgi:hypothetical protein